jgi:hypothetical protein
MVAGVAWLGIWNLLAKTVEQFFVRHGVGVKGSDSIESIANRSALQNALCKLHDHASCTTQPSRIKIKLLNLKGFIQNK